MSAGEPRPATASRRTTRSGRDRARSGRERRSRATASARPRPRRPRAAAAARRWPGRTGCRLSSPAPRASSAPSRTSSARPTTDAAKRRPVARPRRCLRPAGARPGPWRTGGSPGRPRDWRRSAAAAPPSRLRGTCGASMVERRLRRAHSPARRAARARRRPRAASPARCAAVELPALDRARCRESGRRARRGRRHAPRRPGAGSGAAVAGAAPRSMRSGESGAGRASAAQRSGDAACAASNGAGRWRPAPGRWRGRASPPRKSVTKPPASRTSRMPAAMSQNWRSSSQKPSKRPAATQARSSAAEPKRRMPATSGATASRICLEAVEIAMALVGHAGRDQRLGEVAAGRDAQPPLVEPGAPALLRPEALVGERLVDQAWVISPQPPPPASAPGPRSRWRNAGCRGGSWRCRRADRRSSAAWPDRPRSRRLPRAVSPSRAGRGAAPRRWSARRACRPCETKSAGPLRLTCSCSTSPKSRRSRGAALRAARCMTVIRPEWETNSNLLTPLPAREGRGGCAKRRGCRGDGLAARRPPLDPSLAGRGGLFSPRASRRSARRRRRRSAFRR